MDISVAIQVGEDDEPLDKTAEQLAALILETVGGSPSRDFCTVTLNESGAVGVQPGSPPTE